MKIGDQWVAQFVSEGTTYTVTSEVTGEDVAGEDAVYVVKRSVLPSTSGITDMSLELSKATLRPLAMEMSGEYMDQPLSVMIDYSYAPSISPYPLKVGESWELAETAVMTADLAGETQEDTSVSDYRYEVMGTEEIEVPAGSFSCFEIATFDESGTLLRTAWVSGLVKFRDVKAIDHQSGGTVTELVSYSMSY
ncbi:MAG: hypothetical protein SVM79_05760 [Chloroflexota bacterium]|nr:hypothetical protein [Chloroflexota bacterium]